jgi:hypothetical protein
MKLLVVTPTMGQSAFMHETLEGLDALRGAVRHVIVAPADARQRMAKLAPKAEFILQDATGVYAALNRGVAVGGEWDAFTWINDDDRICPAGLQQAWEALQQRPTKAVAYGKVDYIDARGDSLGPLPVESQTTRLASLFSAELPAFTQQGTIIRRDWVERLNGFDTRYRLAADFDFWARALAGGAEFFFVATKVAEYRLWRGQLSRDLATVEREIAQSADVVFPTRSVDALSGIRRSFRIRHFPDMLRRYLHTGCWRTTELYRRAETTLR